MDTDPTTVPGINVIPESRWKQGIPPVMGAHLMDSGAVSALSVCDMHGDMLPCDLPSCMANPQGMRCINGVCLPVLLLGCWAARHAQVCSSNMRMLL